MNTRPFIAFLAVVMATLLTVVATAQPAPRYQGRPIAGVMGWQGHTWLEREGRSAEEDTPQLMAELGVEPGTIVMDLGCGSGFHARRLARAVGPTGEVWCVDLQPEMLEIAKTRARAEGLKNLRYIQGQPNAIPAEAGKVDLLLMVDVYHELADPAAMLAEMKRVLAPTGRVALVEFRLEGDSAAHIKVDHRMSDAQVRKEWKGAGFSLARVHDGLPTQHLFLFRVAANPG